MNLLKIGQPIKYYIQNYIGFDPSKEIGYIQKKSLESPVSDALEMLPFENQRRV